MAIPMRFSDQHHVGGQEELQDPPGAWDSSHIADGGCKATPPKSLGFMDLLFLFFWSGFLRDSRSFEGLMP